MPGIGSLSLATLAFGPQEADEGSDDSDEGDDGEEEDEDALSDDEQFKNKVMGVLGDAAIDMDGMPLPELSLLLVIIRGESMELMGAESVVDCPVCASDAGKPLLTFNGSHVPSRFLNSRRARHGLSAERSGRRPDGHV